VSYRMLLEPLVLQWSVLERLVLERLAVPEPQHLTLLARLARWSARPRRRLVREVKTHLDARSVFHSCWTPKIVNLPARQPSEAPENERHLN
jgi:hypothetical protein